MVDSRTFRQIFDQYSRKVYTFTLWLVRNKAAADDIVQSVFIKLWHKTLLPEDEKSIHLWLMMVARNECIDFFRKANRQHRLRHQYNLESSLYADQPPERSQIWEHLGVLGEKERLIIFLHIREGYSYAEIAQRLEMKENAVRVKAFRAFAKLRTTMIKDQL